MPTALIVEDEPAANQLLSMLVQLRGYRTASAFNGGDALRMVDETRPDLVFLDLMLPDINGYDVCKSLREQRATSEIPVVMVTARLAAENRVRGFRVGALEYLPKPYTPDQIFGAMTKADAWRRRIEGYPDAGQINIKAGDEVPHLRALSDLHSLMLARTPIDEEAIGRANGSLVEIVQRGVNRARSLGIDRVGSLNFLVGPNGAALNLRDESGWFAEDDPRSDGLAGLIQRGGFQDTRFGDDSEIALHLPVKAR